MSTKSKSKKQDVPAGTNKLSEDWLAVIIAFALCLLAIIGVIGPKMINITF